MTVHIAGLDVTVSDHLRQRCAWCGILLVDQDLTAVAVPAGTEDRPFPRWPSNALVVVEGGASALLPVPPMGVLPVGTCVDQVTHAPDVPR